MIAKYCAYPAIALALAAGSTKLRAEQGMAPPPPPPAALPEAARPSFGIGHNVPPSGQWVWQQSIYGGGGGYWAFIKPQNLGNYYGIPDGGP